MHYNEKLGPSNQILKSSVSNKFHISFKLVKNVARVSYGPPVPKAISGPSDQF